MSTKKRKNNKSSGKGKAFLLGAALGAVAGILAAPKSGKATRRDITKTAKKAERKVKTTLKKAQPTLKKARTTLKNTTK
jgi:gas vesicle protein